MLKDTHTYNSQELMALEDRFGAHDYDPIPVVLSKGKGVHLWDVEGKKYYDFLSAYSAVNQGHCHPKIIDALKNQAERLTLTSRAFFSDQLGIYEKFITELFGFETMLPMNTGAEGVETSIKLCRKWAYTRKGVEENKAKIIVCENNFHGRTTTVISFSTHAGSYKYFGPHTPGFKIIKYNDLNALEEALQDKNIAGFLVEPIQGEAGIYVPEEGYLSSAKSLCEKHNVLFIADEIQTGIGRTGRFLACDYENIRPDILILGKALSGGVYPVSAILSNKEIMDVIGPGQHGSTYGGNPLASKIATTALKVVLEEKLTENSYDLGMVFRKRMEEIIEKTEIIKLVRGKGLLNAIVVNDSPESSMAWDICLKLKDNGLLAKPTHGNIIRFAPPLVISNNQINECCDIIEKTLIDFADKKNK